MSLILTLRPLTQPTKIVHMPSLTKVCNEHDTPLIEVWNNGKRIKDYCPVCERQAQREMFEG